MSTKDKAVTPGEAGEEPRALAVWRALQRARTLLDGAALEGDLGAMRAGLLDARAEVARVIEEEPAEAAAPTTGDLLLIIGRLAAQHELDEEALGNLGAARDLWLGAYRRLRSALEDAEGTWAERNLAHVIERLARAGDEPDELTRNRILASQEARLSELLEGLRAALHPPTERPIPRKRVTF